VNALLRHLSISYVTRHPAKTILAVLGIAIGVATFVAVEAAQLTLVSGFKTTVDRLAGHADLQITGVGGVPEALREKLRDLAVVEAEQPVIEQVVQPEDRRLGGLLVLAVDLVGDQSIRDYGFEGEDADVDDPLVFLAQPDSIALSREFASRAKVGKGDSLPVRIAGVTKRFKVRALLEPHGLARAYGGNLAVTDVYAAEDMFGRGRRFDRIDLRIRSQVSLDEATHAIVHAIGSGYRVETPERRGAELQRLATAFVSAFDVAHVFALGLGMFLIFNVFTISVQRRRRDIGILRAIGATPAQVCMLFLCEAALLGALGGAAGVVLGTTVADRAFRWMASALQATEGLSEAAVPSLDLSYLLQGIVVGTVASLVGAWAPSRGAARIQPIDAIATGVFSTGHEHASARRVLAGVVFLGLAFALGRSGLVTERFLLPLVAITGVFGTTMLAGRVARLLVTSVSPSLAWLLPASGRVATDFLLGQPRRTAATAAILTVSAAFVLGTAGYLQAVHARFDRWVDNLITADLVVRASDGLAPSSIRLPFELHALLLQVQGIAAADAFRNERIEYGAEAISLVSVDAKGFADHTRHEFVSGDDRAFIRGLPVQGQCVVSDNFWRQFKLGVGDVVTLESPTGMVRLPIGAVVVMSGRSTVIIDRSTFVARWRDDRVDSFHVTLAPGVDPFQVREQLRTRIGTGTPVLISTRREFVEEMSRSLESLHVVIRSTVFIALVVAFMGVATSLLVSVAERSRDIGILRAIGAVPLQIDGAVILEAAVMAFICLALAIPLGESLAWFLRARVNFAGFPLPPAYPSEALRDMTIGLPLVTIVATWIPAGWAARLSVTEAITYE
jgi:putative ABC transport system permease protein